jgi:hypothetical protein
VCVTAEIAEHLFGATEGWFTVDVPALALQRGAEPSEAFGSTGSCASGSRSFPAACAAPSARSSLPEQGAEHSHGQEVASAGRDPPPPGDGPAAPGDDAMDVRMEGEVTPPGVQHGRDAEQPSEALRVEAEF